MRGLGRDPTKAVTRLAASSLAPMDSAIPAELSSISKRTNSRIYLVCLVWISPLRGTCIFKEDCINSSLSWHNFVCQGTTLVVPKMPAKLTRALGTEESCPTMRRLHSGGPTARTKYDAGSVVLAFVT